MKLVCYIVTLILILVVMALYEKEMKIVEKEAYLNGYKKALKECNQLPVRPIILDDSTGDIDFKCTLCGQECIVPEDNKPKYCSKCGREIDWEDAVYGMQN